MSTEWPLNWNTCTKSPVKDSSDPELAAALQSQADHFPEYQTHLQPHVTASTSTHLFLPPLCNFLDCIRGNDGLGRATGLQEEPGLCPGGIAAELPPRLQLSPFPLSTNASARASALWGSTWALLPSNIPNFGENGVGLRLFPSRQTAI